jgi:site-specific DNA-methyltransferase (adenine-specific)
MTALRWSSPRTGSEVWQADAREVAARLPAGCASLAILDGPYGMGKAAWDRVPRGGSLADLYRGHLDDVGRVCAASASLYLWNTAEGWGELHPLVMAAGWTFRSLIVWDKGDGFMAGKCDVNGLRCWYDVTEVCGFYQREAWAPNTSAGAEIGYAAGRDDRNWVRPWLAAEWARAGLRMKDADRALGTVGMAGHYFQPSQWALPTWEAYQRLAAFAADNGPPPGAVPYLVLERFAGDLRATYDHLRATYDHLRAEYDHLRAEYEASRPPFTAPLGVGNVWRAGSVSGPERLRRPDGETLHPCQKPLLFAERMLRASSRPGDTVWVPFGGTLREVVAAERMARADAADARRVVACELNADGVDYIGPAVAQAEGLPVAVDPRQVGLFGGAR